MVYIHSGSLISDHFQRKFTLYVSIEVVMQRNCSRSGGGSHALLPTCSRQARRQVRCLVISTLSDGLSIHNMRIAFTCRFDLDQMECRALRSVRRDTGHDRAASNTTLFS